MQWLAVAVYPKTSGPYPHKIEIVRAIPKLRVYGRTIARRDVTKLVAEGPSDDAGK